MKVLKVATAIAAMVVFAGSAQATLVDQGNGTVLDDVNNLIWLQNWDVNGRQTWGTQATWAQNLSFAGSSDWLLPTLDQYQTLGNLTSHTNVFQNVRTVFAAYWSRTANLEFPGFEIYYAFNPDGTNGRYLATEQWYAVAVRSNNVVPPGPSVPEPGTLALLGLGLAGLGLSRRRKA
jgi:hypothetical protein